MRAHIIKMDVNVTFLTQAVDKILNWALDRRGRYVCVANVHMCMEAFDDTSFAAVVNNSDLTVADGKPISWAQRALGHVSAQQVRGEDLMLAICQKADIENLPIGFFGATEEVLDQLTRTLVERYPNLNVVYTCTPPFRPMTDEEDKQYVAAINSSDAKVLFVGLGCPRQEIWMADHKDRLNCVMLGVGAAFDFISGNKRQAPKWIQALGLEWLFRLSSEPKRLWKRYLKHNPRFVWYFLLQLLGKKYS